MGTTIGNIITAAFIVAMLVWLRRSLEHFKEKVAKDPFDEYDEPNTATGLGILGTFVGITFGLICFDSQHILDSVPKLLDGMRMAFFTSIAGMVISIGLKWYQYRKQLAYNKANPESTNVSLTEVLAYMKKHDEEVREREEHHDKIWREQSSTMLHYMRSGYESLGKDMSKAIQLMTASIVGDGENTLNSELRRGFAEIKNSNNRIVDCLATFREKFIKEQQKQFNKAMAYVIQNFNDKMSEQLGDNFKTFNQAVGQLVSYQEDYKAKLEYIREAQEQFVRRMDMLVKGFDNIQQGVEKLSGSAMSLEEVSNGINKNFAVLQNGMEQVNQGAARLKEIQPIMDYIAQELTSTAQALEQMAMSQQESVKQIIENEVRLLTEELKKSNSRVAEELNRGIVKSVQETNAFMKDMSVKMTKDLNIRITESLESLGTAMAQISEKFADDYTPLATSLEDIVIMANNLHSKLQQADMLIGKLQQADGRIAKND